MRVPEELTFAKYARQVAIGEEILELVDEEPDKDTLTKLDELMSESVRLMLVDVPDEVVAKLSPVHVREMQEFFSQLVIAGEAATSANG